MLRLARTFVSDRETAEDVVQETWLAVLKGLERFEGRSSLKTWIFQILINRGRTRGRREARSIPFSALATFETEGAEPAVDPSRFLAASHPTEPRHWALPPRPWPQTPEEELLSGEVRERLATALAGLPQAQRIVLTLRDLEGWTAREVCNVLDVSETNQRVLLHRGRSRVRRALAAHLARE
jgi:RNA polymerase sigma-70 factor (ECF subfamily)